MTDSTTRQTLIDVIKAETLLEPHEFTAGQPLSEIIDSLTMLEIVFQIEEQFDIHVADDQLETLQTFEDVVNGVETLLAEK